MAGPLQEATKRVTAEFDVSKDDLPKLVAEFLAEMGEILKHMEARQLTQHR
jgi:hypothetical protein